MNSYSRHTLQMTEETRKLLSSDLSLRIPVRLLARKAGVNGHTLQDCFKQLYGQTIFDFIQGLRMEQAKTLLRGTAHSIQEISEQCGYREKSNFSLAFKKTVGMAPGEWRKRE